MKTYKVRKKERRKQILAVVLGGSLLFSCQALKAEEEIPEIEHGQISAKTEQSGRTANSDQNSDQNEAKTKTEKENGNAMSSSPKESAGETKSREIKKDAGNAAVTLGSVGEVLMHSSVMNGGLKSDGSYDYDYIFDYLRPSLKQLDYSIADMEGTLAGEPYTGYPLFSAPDAVAKAMASAGFSMAVTSNNHMLDRGKEGLLRTVEVLREQGLETIGGRMSAEESPFVMKVINGIKVAFSSFSYETIRIGENKGLNGIPIPKDVEPILDTFSQEDEYIPQDKKKLEERVKAMREAGADLVVFMMHWGTEYLESEDAFSQIYSQTLADAGVDLCFDTGPHVIWPVRMISSQDGKKEMLTFFSMGNIVSDQYFSIGDSNGRCEDGILAIARFEKEKSGKMNLTDAGYLATYCYKVNIGYDASRNHIIPVEAALENPAAFGVEENVNLVQASKERTDLLMTKNSMNGFPLTNYKTLPAEWKKAEGIHTYDPAVDDKPLLPSRTNTAGEEVQGPFVKE